MERRYIILSLFFGLCLRAFGETNENTEQEKSTNGSTSLIREDPVAESLEHDTMAFFALLFMLCKLLGPH